VQKREILSELTIGRRVAEEEAEQLLSYFVETDQWRRIFSGNVDIIFGPKGAGKSALYFALLNRSDDLFDKNILLVSAENPRGTPAFKDLVADPPTTEQEFVGLWKLYILTLLCRVLIEYDLKDANSRKVVAALEGEGLIPPPKATLRTIISGTLEYVRRILRPGSIEAEVKLDATTGLPTGFATKITLAEPSLSARRRGVVSIDELLRLTNESLKEAGLKIWMLFDRLDVAFAESRELEANALRALFKAYLDLLAESQIALKIFLRTDIWRAITSAGFREASHITRHLTIAWTQDSLLNLVVQRILRNGLVVSMYQVDPAFILSSASEQRKFFDRLVPSQVDSGRNPQTFEWLLGRVQDATKVIAPRELIHFLTQAREVQLRILETGGEEPEGDMLFSRQALRDSLPEVSRVRLEQTLFAEYPEMKDYLIALEGEKTHQTPQSLAGIWNVRPEEAMVVAAQLVEIGFFERRGEKYQPSFWVPFLYRPALKMVQGSAD